MKLRAGTTQAPIYVCSNHPFFVQQVDELLQSDNRLGVQFQRNDKPQNGQSSGILVLDVCSTLNWVEVADRWRLKGGQTIIVVPSRSWSREEGVHALSIGVRGIVEISKNFNQILPEAIRSVSTGGLWVSRETSNEYIKQVPFASRSSMEAPSCFTGRETQILYFLKSGFSNKEIGCSLGISERTVKFHVSNILEKARVGSRKALMDPRHPAKIRVLEPRLEVQRS